MVKVYYKGLTSINYTMQDIPRDICCKERKWTEIILFKMSLFQKRIPCLFIPVAVKSGCSKSRRMLVALLSVEQKKIFHLCCVSGTASFSPKENKHKAEPKLVIVCCICIQQECCAWRACVAESLTVVSFPTIVRGDGYE